MNYIDFIKRVIQDAEGFERDGENITTPVGGTIFPEERIPGNIGYQHWSLVWRPLLLQLVIEKINRNSKTTIEQMKDSIISKIWVTEEKLVSAEYNLWGTEIFSKEQAIKHIYEQEKK